MVGPVVIHHSRRFIFGESQAGSQPASQPRQLLLRDGVLAVHFSHWAYACVHGMVCTAVS